MEEWAPPIERAEDERSGKSSTALAGRHLSQCSDRVIAVDPGMDSGGHMPTLVESAETSARCWGLGLERTPELVSVVVVVCGVLSEPPHRFGAIEPLRMANHGDGPSPHAVVGVARDRRQD
jgi:hypothetical protein